jgi:hypothetical protein
MLSINNINNNNNNPEDKVMSKRRPRAQHIMGNFGYVGYGSCRRSSHDRFRCIGVVYGDAARCDARTFS